jgi:tRNA threonylcarbamoyladenosine biosynthesis protein TsaE
VDHLLPIVESEAKSQVPSQVQTGLPPATQLPPLQLQWPDEAATQAFAQSLARLPALGQAFVTLQGDLGAGKTTLARHLLQALGVTGRIKSPTYAIVESYETADFPVWHFDFYRFNDPQEWEDAGFRDIFASPGLKLVEWPQKAEGLLPRADLELSIATESEAARRVTLHSHTALGAALLQGLSAPLQGQSAQQRGGSGA